MTCSTGFRVAEPIEYYRKKGSGDRGFLVRYKDGSLHMRLDRPSQEVDIPYRQGDWELEATVRQFNRFQVARLTYELDRELCKMLGQFGNVGREWLSMRDEDRIFWRDAGPQTHGIRQEVYDAIMAAMAPYTAEQ